MGGEVRSGQNAIIRAARREERRRVRAPDRKRRTRRGKARGRRSVKDAIAVDCQRAHVLSLKCCFLVAVVDRHLVGRLHSRGMLLSVEVQGQPGIT